MGFGMDFGSESPRGGQAKRFDKEDYDEDGDQRGKLDRGKRKREDKDTSRDKK